MERKVKFNEWQKVTLEDFENLGQFPRDSFDHTTKDLGPGWGYSGFSCAITTNAIVTVGAGRLYDGDGKVYFNEDAAGTALNLLANFPTVTFKWVAIVVSGQEIATDTEPRTFIVDTVDRTTEAQSVSTESRRHANIQTVVGIEGPDPTKPSVPSNVITIAWVRLDPSGVVLVEAEEANRVKGLMDHEGRLTSLDAWRVGAGTRLDTLATELASLAGRVYGLPQLEMFLRVITDIVRLKEKADLPDTYSAWGSDYFLDDSESDRTHVDWLARIEEGIRFGHAAERFATVNLLTPGDSKVMVAENFCIPQYKEARRLANVATEKVVPVVMQDVVLAGNWWYGYWYEHITYTTWVKKPPEEISISQYASQSITYKRRARVRYRVRWGNPYYWSSAYLYWYSRNYDPIYWSFYRAYYDPYFAIYPGYALGYLNYPWRHVYLRNRWFWADRITDYYYWDRVVTTHGVNGSVVAQTFLNGQDGWLVKVHLFFTRKAAAGDVNVLLCECYDNGQPNPNAMMAAGVVHPNDIKIWPYATPVNLPPVLMTQGKRYAIIPTTTGNHYLATSERNQLLSGTLFYSTDAIWFQGLGDLTRDLAFELVYAEFTSNRYEVQLESAQLTDGIGAIDINVDSAIPAGTDLTFEAQLNGVWTPLSDPGPDATTSPLTGLPPTVLLRAVFSGTANLMPGMALGQSTQLYTWRSRSDFKHISTPRNVGGATIDTVIVTLRIENWRGPPYHTCTVKLLTGSPTYATVENADATVDDEATDDPAALVRKVTFNIPATVAYKIRIEGTTDNVNTPFHVAERQDIALV